VTEKRLCVRVAIVIVGIAVTWLVCMTPRFAPSAEVERSEFRLPIAKESCRVRIAKNIFVIDFPDHIDDIGSRHNVGPRCDGQGSRFGEGCPCRKATAALW